jgi:hypothetical protein
MKKMMFIVFALVVSVPVFAQQSDGPEGQRRQEMMSKMKQVKIDGIQGRISILQTSLSCVNDATKFEQMRACEQQEHQAMESLMQQQKAKMDAMRPAGGPGGQGGPNGNGQGGQQQ